ncbi:hypothetical protein BDY17DRAFT_291415 [Neohortaea acidophila]|uniref:RING-type domain-containing protein n=1 Tax=Neohortaea acidophila TaxID=245834 RepID=A0A6A6Q2Y0_9PEZI|nr:uncharacterized protein BDY17DRAFT_291415 [Neohortaea acidophila]KAF2486391.1 hypothetical protein BDY17DRAFT_291415 [Neohortaea acidophila]
MSASHRTDSLPPRDDHYENEHAARRQRLFDDFESALRPSQPRYVGDGLDFRRPVMSAAPQSGGSVNGNARAEHPPAAAVIDLTEEDDTNQAAAGGRSSRADRIPRAVRNAVIDLGDSGDEAEVSTAELPGVEYLDFPRHSSRSRYAGLRRPARRSLPPADMDDILFIAQNPRQQPSATSSAAQTPRPRRTATPLATSAGAAETIDLTLDNDDDVVHLNTRQRSNLNNEPPVPVGTRNFADVGFGHMGNIANFLREGGVNIGGRLLQRIQDYAGREDAGIPAVQAQPERERGRHLPAPIRQPGHHHHHRTHAGLHLGAVGTAARIMHEMPGFMNYNMTGFNLGLGGRQHHHHHHHHNQRPPSPKYEPPPPAEAGFTRSPGEDDVLVCPNCGDELAVGAEGAKQEVWVVKGCGHAYCGECAQNRSRTSPKNKKGKGKGKAPVWEEDPSLPPPFKKCVVNGCGKPASSKSMVLVYLGS